MERNAMIDKLGINSHGSLLFATTSTKLVMVPRDQQMAELYFRSSPDLHSQSIKSGPGIGGGDRFCGFPGFWLEGVMDSSALGTYDRRLLCVISWDTD
jgi:hypothetical protein